MYGHMNGKKYYMMLKRNLIIGSFTLLSMCESCSGRLIKSAVSDIPRRKVITIFNRLFASYQAFVGA